ncbi:hypothetical protein PDESU_03330 [Pontiella desulfatans]|uniref:Uncharacterized protein n=1 Tax=Pontiella desulfatans TaxID=2750659 RepID=A0A6C2U5E7_PONDE|nr:hypothetical protein PDESU_03330 [Pontiella desulfatans]
MLVQKCSAKLVVALLHSGAGFRAISAMVQIRRNVRNTNPLTTQSAKVQCKGIYKYINLRCTMCVSGRKTGCYFVPVFPLPRHRDAIVSRAKVGLI